MISFRLLFSLLGTTTDGNDEKLSYVLIVGNRLEFENRLEPPRFILIVQHHYRSNAKWMFAIAAGGCFTFQILNESIGEVIRSARAPSRFCAFCSALGTREFDAILEGIAIQRSPGGVADANRF
jgi:hypothetical protein